MIVVEIRSEGSAYSEPLHFQIQTRTRFVRSLTLDAGAPGAGCFGRGSRGTSFIVSAAVFAPVYKSLEAGRPFVRRLRLDKARQRLSAPECRMEGVARSVGLRDGDNFRRGFERCFGIAPSAYRGRFAVRRR